MRLVYDDEDDLACGSTTCNKLLFIFFVIIPLMIGLTVGLACN